MRRLRKIIVASVFVIILMVAILPLGLYTYTLSLLNVMPEKPVNVLSDLKVSELWVSNEQCAQSQCSSITPYWIYRWLFGAVVNDYISPIDTNSIYGNVSKMASQVAIHHMRQGNINGKGMGWWHLTNIYLSIWLQRNWEAKEIASKYNEIGA